MTLFTCLWPSLFLSMELYTVSVQFNCSVMSDSLRNHRLQHTRPLCPSPTPRVYSSSHPLSQWCHPTISSSVIPFTSCLQSFPASGSFQWVSSSHKVAKVLEFQLQHQSFQWIFRTDFLYDGLVWSPCSPRDSQESSPTPQFKSINSSALNFLYGPTMLFAVCLLSLEDEFLEDCSSISFIFVLPVSRLALRDLFKK